MYSSVTLVGRLGRDPELKYTNEGLPICRLNVATDESYIDRDGKKVEKTEWHRVVIFQRQAENAANFLAKGSLVLIVGTLQTRKWQDQQGQDRYTTEVKGGFIKFLDRNNNQNNGAEQQTQRQGNGYSNRQESSYDDLGPAFPSEASGMGRRAVLSDLLFDEKSNYINKLSQ